MGPKNASSNVVGTPGSDVMAECITPDLPLALSSCYCLLLQSGFVHLHRFYSLHLFHSLPPRHLHRLIGLHIGWLVDVLLSAVVVSVVVVFWLHSFLLLKKAAFICLCRFL
jgi:hypothetical protein